MADETGGADAASAQEDWQPKDELLPAELSVSGHKDDTSVAEDEEEPQQQQQTSLAPAAVESTAAAAEPEPGSEATAATPPPAAEQEPTSEATAVDLPPAAEQEAQSTTAPTESPPSSQQEQPSSSSSSQPRNDYAAFKEQLKHESARPLAAKLQDFARRFPEGLSREQAANQIHRFLSITQDWMLSEVVVFSAEADEEGRANAAEGLEKFLLLKLHGRISGLDKSDSVEDALLARKIDSLSWITFKNLGVPPVDEKLLGLTVEQLQEIDRFKAPRDKLICIRNASHVINDVLQRAIIDSGSAGRPLSADDFLPLLIYCLVLANPPRLQSNLEHIAAFRHPNRLVAEDAYWLTALQSAAAWAKSADHKALEVSEDDFQQFCAQSLAEKGYLPDGTKPAEEQPAESDSKPEGAATAKAKGEELTQDVRQALLPRVKALPMRFTAVQSARHLRVSEASALLEEYREMAKLLREVQRGGSTFAA